MSCINPLIAYPRGLTESGKVKYVPAKRDKGTNAVEFLNFLNEEYGDRPDIDKPILIPCGKCIACRLDYSREWAARCMLEMKDHDSAYFVTLTYNDLQIPKVFFASPDGSGQLPAQTLRKRDFQLWMKRVRRSFPNDKIRFFGCGEYGSQTLRPHYHVILFGLHLDDLKFYKRTETGVLYNSDKLSNTWCRIDGDTGFRFPLGFVVVGECNWDTCAYVARYTAKKSMTVGDEFFEKFGIEKPFIQMSRRPGIGRSYLDKHPDLFDCSRIFLPAGDDVRKCAIPRYFYKALEQSDPDLAEVLRQRRRTQANTYQKAIANYAKRDYEVLLKSQELNLIAKAKALQREL